VWDYDGSRQRPADWDVDPSANNIRGVADDGFGKYLGHRFGVHRNRSAAIHGKRCVAPAENAFAVGRKSVSFLWCSGVLPLFSGSTVYDEQVAYDVEQFPAGDCGFRLSVGPEPGSRCA
jgi:hypothetical protein